MTTISLTLTYPILLIGDAHCDVENIDKVKNKHSEITNRIFLGDLFDFIESAGNPHAGKWLEENILEYIFILGNHDRETFHTKNALKFEQKALINNYWYVCVKIQTPDGKNYVLCHSKPNNLWDFINPGQYTFREFEDDFSLHVDENTIACINGHTHRAAKHVFQETDTEIWTIGAIKDRHYAILTEKGIEFKKI